MREREKEIERCVKSKKRRKGHILGVSLHGRLLEGGNTMNGVEAATDEGERANDALMVLRMRKLQSDNKRRRLERKQDWSQNRRTTM